MGTLITVVLVVAAISIVATVSNKIEQKKQAERAAQKRAAAEKRAAEVAKKQEELAEKVRELNEQRAANEARAAAAREKWEFISFNVRGVTFTNADGTERQTILRKIKRKLPPFNSGLSVSLTEYDYHGEPALSVTVNGYQVGNVPAELVPKILEKWDRIDRITAFDVTGGGRSKYGNSTLNYGAEVCVRFFRQVPQ